MDRIIELTFLIKCYGQDGNKPERLRHISRFTHVQQFRPNNLDRIVQRMETTQHNSGASADLQSDNLHNNSIPPGSNMSHFKLDKTRPDLETSFLTPQRDYWGCGQPDHGSKNKNKRGCTISSG